MINKWTFLSRSAMVATLGILAACGGGGSSSPPPTPTKTNDSVVATASPTGTVSVAVGSSATFSVTFTTDDGETATGLSITSGLSALPAGWTGPATFTCASVSTGNGCMVNLTYHPTAAGSGSVTLDYSYTNNAGTAKTGTATVSYAATSNNNIVATPSPAGQIAVVTGGTSAVSITFTTDDGRPATNLSITGLGTLPAGWAGPASFTCPSVSTGSGCLLKLTYAPSAAASGTLSLGFTYKNDAGTPKTGSVNVSYAATAQNQVIATTTPAGQIVAVIGGPAQTVKVDFTTSDSTPATGLTVTPATLTSLPGGWTGPATFTCATLSTGNGCELSLSYAPTVPNAGGTVSLSFGYTNNSGVAKTGTVNISYSATADNTVVGIPLPSGTINAVVGGGTQNVTVTFNSNDSDPATQLAITGGLTALPSGWSALSTTFTCATVNNTGSSCQLALAYTPPAAASGTVQLSFGYHAHSGTAKTGTVMIPYAATTNNNLVATQSPSGSISAVVNAGSVPVTLTFTTDDGNPATLISITSGLGLALPAGWSGPSTFTCATASTGTGCQVALTYAPTVNGSGTVALGYSYTDDAGTVKTGTANIAYASLPHSAYITDLSSNVWSCAISGVDGTLSGCVAEATGLKAPSGIAFSGNWAYVTPGLVATDVDVCPVNANGSLGACTSAATFTLPSALAVSGGYLYVTDTSGAFVFSCPINNTTGGLGTCTSTNVGTVDTMDGIAVTATTAYIVDINDANLTSCAVSAVDGSLSACTQNTLNGTAPGGGNTPTAAPRSAAVYGGNLYIGTHAGDMFLTIASDGTVTPVYSPTFCSLTPGTSCTIDGDGLVFTSIPQQTPITGFAFNNGYAYVTGLGGGGGVAVCTIEPTGVLDNCASTATSSLPTGVYGGLAVH